jgi:transcriptional regulator with XRE-family HTH domain
MGNEPSTSNRLGEKLAQIRAALGVSQNDLIALLNFRERLDRSYISNWEHGKMEPSLNELLRYAHLAGVSIDALLQDAMNLPPPKWIRSSKTHAGKMSQDLPASKRLGEKLYQIRAALNLSQNDMIDHLGFRGVFDRAYISFWENGKIEPPLEGVIRYAAAGGVSVQALADDALKITLPKQIYRQKTRA